MSPTRARVRGGDNEGGFRVLLAAHQGLTPGGVGTIAKGLATHLPAALEPQGTVHVAMPKQDGRVSAGLRAPGGRRAAARIWHEQVSLPRMTAGFDLVHLCDPRPIVLGRTPFLITIHDLAFLDRPDWVPAASRLYKAGMLRAALRKGPAAIVCVSEHTRGRLEHHFPRTGRSDVSVIHPGVHLADRGWTGAGDPPFFVTVSAILPRKNHLGLLRAFRQARRRGLEAQWKVAGPPGPLSRGIVRSLEQEPGVHVLGEVDEGQLDRLYREALFVATPSAHEGFGFPPLEAMARGVPTLTSSAGSLPEVVGDAGPLLPPADATAWAEALVWLAGDAEARRELSEKGSQRAREFSWQRTAERTVGLYRDIRDRG